MQVKSGANLYNQAKEATANDSVSQVSDSSSSEVAQKSSVTEIAAAASNQVVDTVDRVYQKSFDETVGIKSDLADGIFKLQLGVQLRDNNMPIIPWNIERNRWDTSSLKHFFPKTLLTGSGDDQVDVQMGTDNRVHVNVNGKEAWNGTIEEFRYLTIDTGDGNDSVKNTVSGANIVTGKGNDTVDNEASYTTIDTGEGNDEVHDGSPSYLTLGPFGAPTWSGPPESHDNTINTGDGDDYVSSAGRNTVINTGRGDDEVIVRSDEKVNTGEGDDIVNITGSANTVNTESGNDEVIIGGSFNNVNTGEGLDIVEIEPSLGNVVNDPDEN